MPSPRPTLPFLLVLALGAAPAPGQQTPDTDFSQATRPVVRITDPLVIETYSDDWTMDAENNLFDWWPNYSQGGGDG